MKDSKKFRVQLCRRGRFSVKAPCLKTQSRTEGRHSQVTAAGAAAALMNLVHIISRNVTTSYAVLGSFLESTVSPTSCLAVSTTTSSPSSTKSLWSDNMWPTKARYFFFFLRLEFPRTEQHRARPCSSCVSTCIWILPFNLHILSFVLSCN